MSTLLVVAGEASGDRAAAAVVRRLEGVRAFGLGGPALAGAGVDVLDDMRAWTAMGIGETGRRAARILRAAGRLLAATRTRSFQAALLTNYSEFNSRLAPRLHAAGVRVLWYGAPQVWAWRPERTVLLRRWIDRMAVMLPFEEPLWRSAGVDAHYVGHPALETTPLERDTARRALGMTPFASAVAILPGSRPHEVKSLLLPMLDAYEMVRTDRASVDGRVLIAASLDRLTRAWVQRTCESRRVATFDVDAHVGATSVLRAFDAALCVRHGVARGRSRARRPGHRVSRGARDRARGARARANRARGAAQRATRAARIPRAPAAGRARTAHRGGTRRCPRFRRGPLVSACDEVEATLRDRKTPSLSVARMLAPWLGTRAHAA